MGEMKWPEKGEILLWKPTWPDLLRDAEILGLPTDELSVLAGQRPHPVLALAPEARNDQTDSAE